MMHDRFAGQLRQHLLETADERPAQGQFAAVVKRVAVTNQRHPLAARLTWNPGRTGPFPSATLRYGLIAVALILAMVAVLIVGGGGPSGKTVFEGTWTATDPGDGSIQSLVVGPGTTPAVQYVDDFASGARCVADAVKVFTADGTGTIVGNRLDVEWPEGGGCGLMTVPMSDGSLAHQPPTDTLIDGLQVTWTRVQDAVAPPTRAPVTQATQPPATFPAFAVGPSYTCDLLAGTYGGRFGSLRVTATTPTTWHGLDDVFHLEDEGCQMGGAVQLEITLVSEVYADTCRWQGAGVDAGTAAAARAAFTEEQLFDVVGPTDTTLSGYQARRYDFTLPGDLDTSTCSSSVLQFWRDPARDEGFGPTLFWPGSVTVYFVEVDGLTLGVYAFKWEDLATPALRDALDSVVASLRFEP